MTEDQVLVDLKEWFLQVGQDEDYYSGEGGRVHAERDARALFTSVVGPLLAQKDEEIATAWSRLAASQMDLLARGIALDRAEASRRDWAAEADQEKARANGLLTLLDVFHDDSPCRWDHNHSCQAHDFPDVPLGEPCPQQVIGEVLAKAKEDAAGALVCMCLPDEQVQTMRDGLLARPVCAVHPDGA